MKVEVGGLFRTPFLITTLLVLAADLLSKSWAFDVVKAEDSPIFNYPRIAVIDGIFYLARVENTGTIWGLGQGYPNLLRVVRCVMVLILLWMCWEARRNQRLKLVSLGLVLGGAIGNLYDNFTQAKGAVRDFLDFYIPLPWLDRPYHYPVFNLADSCILIGAILLFWAFSREGRQEEVEVEAASTES
ncbi:MAG: signal peptidase II [Planctomycetota bacterium]